MEGNQRNQDQINCFIKQNGVITPNNEAQINSDEFPSADSIPSRIVDRELRVSLEDNIPLNSTSRFGMPSRRDQATQPQTKGPKLSHRLSGVCPHSTPNVIRVAPTRGLERIRARHQDNQEELKEHQRSNSGIIQQDLARPNEIQNQNSILRVDQYAQYQQRRIAHIQATNSSLDESFTGFGSASSTQLIQLYRTGLNMRPNTPTGPPKSGSRRNIGASGTSQEDSPQGPPQNLPQRLHVSQLRSNQSNYGDYSNQAYLSIQERKVLNSNVMGLQISHPLAPYGTQSQSTQDLPTLDSNVQVNLTQEPALAGAYEFLTALNGSQQQVSHANSSSPIRHEIQAEKIDEIQVEVDDGSKAEELSLNAPINTVDCRSPPSLGSPIREVNETQPASNQRRNPVPPGPCASRLQNFTEAHTQSNVSAVYTRQLHTQNQSSVLPSCLPELIQNAQPQPSVVSQASSGVPEMPPNTNTDYARSSPLQHSALGNIGGSVGLENINDQDQDSADIGGQTFAISQTMGALTTMAQSSQQDNQSQVTLSGAAGLRPQNLFHRDEMFQIYLQRPPPPSPLRNRIRSQIDSQSSELRMQAQRISSPRDSQSRDQEPAGSWAPLRPGLIQAQGQAFSPTDSSILDGDLVDEVDRIAQEAHKNANVGSQSRSSARSQANIQPQHSSGSSSVHTGQQLNVTREEEGNQSLVEQIQPRNRTQQINSPQQVLESLQSSSHGVTRVYHEVIENQHKSNQQTLRGLERVAAENEALRRRVAEMERESQAMRQQVANLQRVMLEHSRICPLLGRLSLASNSPRENVANSQIDQQANRANCQNEPILRLSSNKPLPQGKSDHESEESKD